MKGITWHLLRCVNHGEAVDLAKSDGLVVKYLYTNNVSHMN